MFEIFKIKYWGRKVFWDLFRYSAEMLMAATVILVLMAISA